MSQGNLAVCGHPSVVKLGAGEAAGGQGVQLPPGWVNRAALAALPVPGLWASRAAQLLNVLSQVSAAGWSIFFFLLWQPKEIKC